MSDQLQTPVALLIFQRPDTTAKVFAEVARARPRKLLVVADGPRANREGEAERCAAARRIIEGVDWPCEVLTNYAERNLGCKHRVSTGLDWVFEQVPEAIILEDDCVPDVSFFRYCEELLMRYRDDERVMCISGTNFWPGPARTEYSYGFSRYSLIWGWASWRRAWRHYDVDINVWPLVRDGGWLTDVLRDAAAVEDWSWIFERLREGEIDTWDYQWTLACWLQNGLCVLPTANLVRNIGFGMFETHPQPALSLSLHEMDFPLKHPMFMVRDEIVDAYTQRTFYPGPALWRRMATRGLRALGLYDAIRLHLRRRQRR